MYLGLPMKFLVDTPQHTLIYIENITTNHSGFMLKASSPHHNMPGSGINQYNSAEWLVSGKASSCKIPAKTDTVA